LKSFPKPAKRALLVAGIAVVTAAAVATRGEIPKWLQNIESATPAENALFRRMAFPGGNALAHRPPQEARPLLDGLVQSQPNDAKLYSLRAMEEEQQLDFDSAEKDWKSYAQLAADRTSAELDVADFYHRRARPADEVTALLAVAQSPSSASDGLLPPPQEQAWLAFSRIFGVISDNALPAGTSDTVYRAWIARYPRESSLYARYLEFLLAQKEYDRATDLIGSYGKAFPDDAIFPVKALALLDYRKGNVQQGLAAYDGSFKPLWPQELIQGYFGLMGETHSLRKFLDTSQAAYHANPDDLNAMARIFYYYQQEGKPDAAEDVVADFRAHKETAGTRWTGNDLYTLARLLERIQAYPEAARYYYALYNAMDNADNRPRALAGLANILPASPDQPLRLGAGDLSMYRDIGTADPGPGFLNGILSLLFNSEDPAASLATEEQSGASYFHREEAAKLLTLLDQQYPAAPERADLHARLLQAYVDYSQNDAVISSGKKFLQDFPDSPQRTQVSLLMADAYARLGQTDNEFAIYDAVLRELAQKAQNVPLGATFSSEGIRQPRFGNDDRAEVQGDQDSNELQSPDRSSQAAAASQAFQINSGEVAQPAGPRSPEYDGVLERYLSRLASLNQVPQALEVLRREVDRNPNDPGLYERLAQFLQQNQLGAQEEEVYQRAIQQFPDRSWYDKLARLYLRQRRTGDFEQLTTQVVKIFAGSELEAYFSEVVARSGFIGPQFYLRLNIYANQRFPHNLVFVHNLLNAYQTRGTTDEAARENLLRQHWFEDDGLSNEYFEFLSRTHQLDGQMQALAADDPNIAADDWHEAAQANPVAVRFFSEAELWQSHFESGMPALGALAEAYPADFDLGRQASSVYHSLAYIDPKNTAAAVRVEQNLSKSNPADRDTLARIGDIYADRGLFTQAAPYWNHMADIEPGKPDSYVEAATVFWDYYKFDDALRLLNEGRAKLGNNSLFSYEEGAIYENERDYPHAIAEYVNGALAGDANSQSLNRLLDLARRPALKSAVDAETANVVDPRNPAIAPIRIRVKVLEAQDRKADIRAFLLDEIGRTASLELAEQIEALAQ
jgi:cellulose synthase operon protein C